MSTRLFELGEATPAGPEYDVEAAARFYLPMQEKVAGLGLNELAARLEQMAEIDARIMEDALASGSAPIFLTPDAYPIEGEASRALVLASNVRRLFTNPDLKTLHFGPVRNEVGSETDLAVGKEIEELEQLLVHPDYEPVGYIEPDNRTFHWYMPTVFEGIAIQKEEITGNANEGAYTMEDGRPVDLPPKYIRRLGLIVYRTGSSPSP